MNVVWFQAVVSFLDHSEEDLSEIQKAAHNILVVLPEGRVKDAIQTQLVDIQDKFEQ